MHGFVRAGKKYINKILERGEIGFRVEWTG